MTGWIKNILSLQIDAVEKRADLKIAHLQGAIKTMDGKIDRIDGKVKAVGDKVKAVEVKLDRILARRR